MVKRLIKAFGLYLIAESIAINEYIQTQYNQRK